ncbi:MAG: hypothetical protein AAF415_00925 [Pseudomonadota bacterium]
MRFIAFLWITVGLALLSAPGKAMDLPGADDPRFQAAVDDWLEADPQAVFTLVDIADQGNVTAQLLVTKIRLLGYHRKDLAHLDWHERRKLMTPKAGWQLEASLPDHPVDPFWG